MDKINVENIAGHSNHVTILGMLTQLEHNKKKTPNHDLVGKIESISEIVGVQYLKPQSSVFIL